MFTYQFQLTDVQTFLHQEHTKYNVWSKDWQKTEFCISFHLRHESHPNALLRIKLARLSAHPPQFHNFLSGFYHETTSRSPPQQQQQQHPVGTFPATPPGTLTGLARNLRLTDPEHGHWQRPQKGSGLSDPRGRKRPRNFGRTRTDGRSTMCRLVGGTARLLALCPPPLRPSRTHTHAYVHTHIWKWWFL